MNTLLFASFALSLALAPQDPAKEPAKDSKPRDVVKERLESSPRHHEWIDVKSGARTVRCFVAFPEVKEKAALVIVIHENKGLTDWARSVVDQLAEAGYVAIAPDMLSGAGPEGGNTDSFKSVDEATKAIGLLDAAQVGADLDAVADHGRKLDACNGRLFVAGFCWGGSRTFEYAARGKDLAGAFVFYGSAPKDEALFAEMNCTVYGFYGESDARITSGIAATSEAMKKASKSYEPVTYAGAGHGFMRAGESAEASEANKTARTDAWARWKELLAKGSAQEAPKAPAK